LVTDTYRHRPRDQISIGVQIPVIPIQPIPADISVGIPKEFPSRCFTLRIPEIVHTRAPWVFLSSDAYFFAVCCADLYCRVCTVLVWLMKNGNKYPLSRESHWEFPYSRQPWHGNGPVSIIRVARTQVVTVPERCRSPGRISDYAAVGLWVP